MNRTAQQTAFMALSAMTLSAPLAHAAEREKPNVIWYMIEDTSPQFLGLYNNGKGAKMPNLEKFAKDAIIYDNAFSSAPVSSAARTTLITGCYAPRFAGSFHRRLESLPMPEGLRMFPSYLREAGYFTINASKTDYNVDLDKTAWDQIKGNLGDWNKRKSPDQPFFMVRTNAVTHESSLLFDENTYKTVKTKTNPDKVYVHPHLPQTDLMKYTYATFYDRQKDADDEFGEMLDMLKADGLMDNTFVFFFGDNGGCVPQSKGYTNDVGFRVPLLIYVPEKWRDEVGLKPGKHTDGMVSFIDFGATVMNLAGITDLPAKMNGKPFLGKGANEDGRESLVCYGDRYDDLYAFNRVLYRGNYRYARNYTPYHMRGLFSYYRYKSLALQESCALFHAGKLNATQAKFFEPLGAEELYDVKNDPNELNNLANDPVFQSVLTSMRYELAAQVDGYCDLGFLPETIVNEEAMKNPESYGVAHQKELISYRLLADLQLSPLTPIATQKMVTAMGGDDAVAKWWALTSASFFGNELNQCNDFKAQVAELTASYNRSFVRSRAFVAQTAMGGKIAAADVQDMLHRSRTLGEVMVVLNDMAYLREMNLLPTLKLTLDDAPFADHSVEERIAYLNK